MTNWMPLIFVLNHWMLLICPDVIMSEQIVISPYLNAFKIFEPLENIHRETFSYANPVNYDFNVTINFGDKLKGKMYSKSNLKVTIHSDKYDYYELENTDSYLLNTICKFDYGSVSIFLYKTVCCRATIQDHNFTTNDFYTQNFCKFAPSRHSSACFIQLLFTKSFINRNVKSNHFYFGLKAYVFATNGDSCNHLSKVNEVLAGSRLYPLSFSTGLGVVWNTVFRSKSDLRLDIGRPLHSLEPDTVVYLPLRLITDQLFQYLKIECHLGDNVDIKSIIFDNNLFDADYDNSMRTNAIASIDLNFKGSDTMMAQQWWVKTGLLLFIIRAHVIDGSTDANGNGHRNGWIKCFVKQMKNNNRIIDDFNMSGKINVVPLSINSGKFIIIPIFETTSYFSILSDFQLPIQLQDDFLKVYSIHNIRDGSFIDVSNKVNCQPVDTNSILCPNSMIKFSDNYFGLDSALINSTTARLAISKWDIVLRMETWNSIVYSPLDLWIAENWRLELSDRKLSEINGWRFPLRSASNQRLICQSMFQISQIKIIAKLAKRNEIGEKEYFGQNDTDKSPLLDITSHLRKESIQIMSNSKANIIFNLDAAQFHVSPTSNYGAIDIQLWSSNTKRLLAVNRITIIEDRVEIRALKVYCIESMDLYENSYDLLSNYRHMYVESSYENNTTRYCYLSVIVIYSDQSEQRLNDIPTKYYRLFHSVFDVPTNLWIVRQIHLSTSLRFAPKMNLSLHESTTCDNAKPIFSTVAYVNDAGPIIKVAPSSSSPQLPTKIILKTTTVTTLLKTPETDLMKDLSSLYYGLYALIVLVAVVAVIALINCLFKLNYRKISRQIASANNQAVTSKLLNTTQSPPSVDASSPNYSKHHPLLPPPGPLRNSNDSPNELASSAFWRLSSTQESTGNRAKKKYSYSFHENPMPLSTLPSPSIRSSPLVGSMYSNNRYTHNPSPSSDQADGGYLSSENTSKHFDTMFKRNMSEIQKISAEDLERNENISELASINSIFPVPPPCPPLKWSIQWATSMGSTIPVFSQSCLSSKVQEHCNIVARTVPTSDSTASMNQWLNKKCIQLSHTVPYTKSIDNLCEKSSGLGSLTSTQQEDSSLLSDEDNYHVSINSDKEAYRKYVKKV